MKFFIFFFFLSLSLTPPDPLTPSLYAELLYTPAYAGEEALKLPSNKETALELLWSSWKNISPAARGRTGLVLSGGGARGFGHVGVLQHLDEIGFPVEAIAGTSMGAVVGGLYAAGVPLLSIEKMAEETGFKKLQRFTTMTFLRLGLSDGLAPAESWKNWIDAKVGDKTFGDLRVPFIACMTDLASGELVLLREGPLAPALLAAGTIPGLFAPVAIRQYFLVDGGLLLNVPTEAMRLLDAENTLISDVSARGHVEPITRAPSSLAALYRVIEIQGNRLDNEQLKDGDYRIRFYPSGIDLFELWRWREAWEAGLRAARDNSGTLRWAFISKSARKLGSKFFSNNLSASSRHSPAKNHD